jgi:transcriptional regulator with XRE-family HTH domain
MQYEEEDDEEIFFSGAGEVIRRYRIGHHLTLEELAQRIGREKSSLQRYETNETPLSDRLIQEIALGIKIEPTTLMRECLMFIRPKLRYSPFGVLLDEMETANTRSPKL